MTNPLQGSDEETPKPLTPEERRRVFVERAEGRWLAAEHRGWNDAAKYELLSRYEATVDSLESALREAQKDVERLDRLDALLGPSPIDALQSAFIAGMDKCREIQQAYGEWPSLTGRCELAADAFPADESLVSDAARADTGEST